MSSWSWQPPWQPPWRLPRSGPQVGARLLADDGKAPFSAQHLFDRAPLPDRKYDDRHTVFLGKREGRGVHDLQALIQGLLMAQAIIALGLRVLLRIGGIDAVDVGGLEDSLAAHLGRAQDSRGIGGEIGISGAAGEHDDAFLVEMAQR